MNPSPEVPDVLACGASVVDLVDQADAGRLEPADEHQVRCPHCRAALRAAATSRDALRLLDGSAGPVPAGLVDRVMAEVRRTRRPTALLELDVRTGGPDGVRGRIRLHPQVLADLARTAAGEVRGVQVVRAVASGGASTQAGGGAVQVRLGLVVDGRTPLPLLARRLRRAVRGAVRAVTGLGELEVELAALDLIPPRNFWPPDSV